MINITNEAKSIFKKEISKEENKNFKLRVAAMRKKGDNFQYAIGFDDNVTQNDKILKAQELIKQKYTVEAIESEWVDVVLDQ